MHDDDGRLERISALADGQLDRDQFEQTIAWAATSQEACVTWHAYHVMGDVLRSTDLADCSRDRDFVLRLRERLTQLDATTMAVEAFAARSVDGVDARPEPARRVPMVAAVVAPVVADTALRGANDAVLRWKWLAAAASLMAVTVLGWHVGSVGTDTSARLASAPSTGAPATVGAAVPGTEPSVMLRDPRLDELLAAHRQFGGASALQMPAGFLRNATFEQPGR